MKDENGWNEEFWTVVMLWVAFVVFGAAAYLNEDPVYGGVFIWACLGISAENYLDSSAVEYSLYAILSLMSALEFYVALA